MVELALAYDHAENTTRVAEQLILDLLSVLFLGSSAQPGRGNQRANRVDRSPSVE
ncbi:hypothetical protein ACFLX9_02230 [Chloroflexota bacterium]